MPEETVVVEIDADGNVEISVQGIQGPGCVALTKALEDHLGIERERKRTREYYVGRLPQTLPQRR